MKLPIDEVNNYLNTNEMYDVIQTALNEEDKNVQHFVEDIEILAYHDEELEVRWELIREGTIIKDAVLTVDLDKELKELV